MFVLNLNFYLEIRLNACTLPMNSLPQKQLAIRLCGVPSFAELLYFDEITILLHGFADFVLGKTVSEEEIARLDYLESYGVVRKLSHFLGKEGADKIYERELLQMGQEALEVIVRLLPETEKIRVPKLRSVAEASRIIRDLRVRRKPNVRRPDPKLEKSPEYLQAWRQIELHVSGPLRQTISCYPEYEATTIFSEASGSSDCQGASPVFQITLNKFPIPVADTPLEKVLEFRSDRAAMDSRRRLQRWMRKISEQNLTPRQIEDEIEELLDQYTEHMKLYRMKYCTTTLHGLFTASLGALENVVRLKFTDAMNAFLTLRANRLALTEAEMNSPGRQVAYIVRAREKFVR